MHHPACEALVTLPVLVTLAAVHLNLRAEDLVSVALQMEALPEGFPGVSGALDQALAGTSAARKPRILISRDPLPRAWILRAAGGTGRILLTQGLLALLNEEELRAVLRCAVIRLAGARMPYRTFCASLAARLDLFLPRGGLTPLKAIVGCMLYPLARFLAGECQELDLFRSAPPREVNTQRAWLDALSQVRTVQCLHETSPSMVWATWI